MSLATPASASSAEAPPSPPGAPAPRSCWHLAQVFNRLALQGFGGVLPAAQHELVERQRWLTREQFLELLSIGQLLPGPNVVNMAIMLGDRHFGWRGAAAAVAGILLAPLIIVLALAALVVQWREQPALAGALRGMGVVASGLVFATALKLMAGLKSNSMGFGSALVLGAAAFVFVGVMRWPLIWAVLGLGGLGWLYAAWRIRRRDSSGPSQAASG